MEKWRERLVIHAYRVIRSCYWYWWVKPALKERSMLLMGWQNLIFSTVSQRNRKLADFAEECVASKRVRPYYWWSCKLQFREFVVIGARNLQWTDDYLRVRVRELSFLNDSDFPKNEATCTAKTRNVCYQPTLQILELHSLHPWHVKHACIWRLALGGHLNVSVPIHHPSTVLSTKLRVRTILVCERAKQHTRSSNATSH
jgi:hypothetical protein